MANIIGIDLGTTNSVVAVLEGGEPHVIPSSEGGHTVPSVVAETKDGSDVVGEIARRQAVINPINTITSVKRFIGRKFSEVGDEIDQVPYTVVAGKDNRAEIVLGDRSMTPEAISAKILAKLIGDAEAYLGGEKITRAVITVPAYFNDAQRQATKVAGKIAGLDFDEIRIINEPTAAALAYGLGKADEQTILVFDLGGGTFDVSVLEFAEGVFQVLSTSGDTHLGGDDYDRRIVDLIAARFAKENPGAGDLRDQPQALARLNEAAEKAKIELSTLDQTSINLPFISAVDNVPAHVECLLTRAEFEAITRDLTERCRAPVADALAEAGISAADLNEVILVGGSSRMPAIGKLVRETSGREPHRGVNPDEVVALGASIQAGVLSGVVKDVLLLDVTPLSLGIDAEGGQNVKLIERNTTIPTEVKKVFSTESDNQESVDIVLVQGERRMAADCRILGKVALGGLPAGPKGSLQIQVKLNVDADGILTVTADELTTNKHATVTITNSTQLDDNEIERMVQDAAAHAADDQVRAGAALARAGAEEILSATDVALSECRALISEADVTLLEQQSAAFRSALDSGDDASLSSSYAALTATATRASDEVKAQISANPDLVADGADHLEL